jgi:hypothetical protein
VDEKSGASCRRLLSIQQESALSHLLRDGDRGTRNFRQCMMPIFRDFCQLSAKKLTFFLEKQCFYDDFRRFLPILDEKIDVFLVNQC